MPPELTEEEAARAALYRDYLAERTEILTRKWVMSEKAGHDVGFETALLDWAGNHRTTWKKQRPKNQSGQNS